MLIASFPAGPWQTNCYVVATEPGAECVVIDPGMDATSEVEEVVREQQLRPVAVLVTHGHLDHMASVAPLCRQYRAPVWVHADDRALLSDPLQAMSPDTHTLLKRLSGSVPDFVEPDDVREWSDGTVVEVAGLTFTAIHAPGHTPGSTLLQTAYAPDDEIDSLVFSGDVLFAGSIGRTDLPGGDHADMLRSLRTKVLPLPDSAVVLPGHSPQTTMARERATNPYLREDAL